MPIRWSSPSSVRSSPIVSAFLSTIAKTSKQTPAKQAIKSHLSATSSSSARKSTSTNSSKWAANSSSSSSQSSARNSHLSTLSNIAFAGTGTFASTLLALYLATVVEKSAHELLYEYFPEKYFEIREEDLPACLKDEEMRRRLFVESSHDAVDKQTFEIKQTKDAHAMTGKMVGLLVDSTQMMGMFIDDDRIEDTGKSVGQLVEEEEQVFQKQLSRNNELNSESAKEEFSWGEPTLFSSYAKNASSKSSTSSGLIEAKRLQEESKILQERLMSVAMTA